jgi:Transmembrane family 220, helix
MMNDVMRASPGHDRDGEPQGGSQAMRYINGFFCVLLVLFTSVQYNDPDAPMWIALYGVPALWAGLAAARPERLARSQGLLAAFGATLVVVAGFMVYWWPRPQSVASWWQSEVVHGGMGTLVSMTAQDNELVREGLGLMIATVALLLVAYTLWRTRHAAPLAVNP